MLLTDIREKEETALNKMKLLEKMIKIEGETILEKYTEDLAVHERYKGEDRRRDFIMK